MIYWCFHAKKKKVKVKVKGSLDYYGATTIISHRPKFEWDVNGVEKLLKKIDKTGNVARKKGSGQPKSVHTEENIELVEEIFHSLEDQPETQNTAAKTPCELNIDCQSVLRITDQHLHLLPLRKCKLQKFTD